MSNLSAKNHNLLIFERPEEWRSDPNKTLDRSCPDIQLNRFDPRSGIQKSAAHWVSFRADECKAWNHLVSPVNKARPLNRPALLVVVPQRTDSKQASTFHPLLVGCEPLPENLLCFFH
jgi:hypothetical protein